MKNFVGLEGARGWLSWLVVLSHVLLITGMVGRFEQLKGLQELGDVAVRVFVILSGFVITHLIVEKNEAYAPYIIRRFMRIYPVYLVCLTFAVGATLVWWQTVLTSPWAELSASTKLVRQIESSQGLGFLAHLAAHLTMLHGMIPSNLLFDSQYFFLPPAWSLSLEWQFYLVAPLVVFLLLGNRLSQAALIGVVIFSTLAYTHGYLGEFILPSFLPGAALLFAVGILSRLASPFLMGRFEFPIMTTVFVFVATALFARYELHLAIWAALMAYSLANEEGAARRLPALLLDSRVATWFGRRSYATYLVHVPIIYTVIAICSRLEFSYWAMVATLAIATPLMTLVASHLLHALVELPGMRLGHRLAMTAEARLASMRDA
jgi:peptidoglycan/LPS O-acetylase OafA/YrhL